MRAIRSRIATCCRAYITLLSVVALILLSSLVSVRADFLYVSETTANIVRKYDLDTGADLGVFASTGLLGPQGLAFDGFGNLYVANVVNGTVSKITPEGVSSTFAIALSFPHCLAIDTANNIFVSDPYGGSIAKLTPSGDRSTFAYFGVLGLPIGLAFDPEGNLYGGHGNGLIAKYAPDGSVSSYITGAGGNDLVFDAAGNLFSSNLGDNTIAKISPEGVITTFATGLKSPGGLDFDGAGNLFVAEINSKTIRKIAPDGSSSVFASLDQSPTFLAIQVTPEPTSAAMVGLGLTGFLLLHNRKS